MTDKDLKFVKLQFENGKDITEEQISAEYAKGNYNIYIELTNDCFAESINLPSSYSLDPILGSVVHIKNASSKVSELTAKEGEIVAVRRNIPAGGTCIAMGVPNTGWMVSQHQF